MSTAQIILWVAAAALLFWAVGAYNRLVRMRSAIVRQFAAVDAQFRERQALLEQLIDTLVQALPHAAERLAALRAACFQADAACAHARLRPGAVSAITSLRLADDIVGEARARLPVQSAPGLALAPLNAQLAVTDVTLAFARRQFNDTVADYNLAVRQFPTLLLVGLFGFRAAGTL